MKTLIRKGLFVAIMCGTLTSYASSVEPIVSAKESDQKMVTLVFRDWDRQEVKLSIKSKNREVLHSEDLHVSRLYYKKYDLKALQYGQYALEVENENVVSIMPFEINKNGISFIKAHEHKVYKPYIRQREQFTDIMFRGCEYNATRVLVFNDSGQLLQKLKVKAGQNIEKILDFSQLPSGEYRLTFSQGHHRFDYYINV